MNAIRIGLLINSHFIVFLYRYVCIPLLDVSVWIFPLPYFSMKKHPCYSSSRLQSLPCRIFCVECIQNHSTQARAWVHTRHIDVLGLLSVHCWALHLTLSMCCFEKYTSVSYSLVAIIHFTRRSCTMIVKWLKNIFWLIKNMEHRLLNLVQPRTTILLVNLMPIGILWYLSFLYKYHKCPLLKWVNIASINNVCTKYWIQPTIIRKGTLKQKKK